MDAALLREAKAIRRRVEELTDRLDVLEERIAKGESERGAKPKPRKKNEADPFDTGGDGDDDGGDGSEAKS